MKTITITRDYSPLQTKGKVVISEDDTKLMECFSLELPWLENAQKISCIPEGTYTGKLRYSAKFNRFLFEIQNVPGRSSILIHIGNYASPKKSDVEGCILLGSSYGDINTDGIPDILNSTVTINKFYEIMGEKDCRVIITSNFPTQSPPKVDREDTKKQIINLLNQL